MFILRNAQQMKQTLSTKGFASSNLNLDKKAVFVFLFYLSLSKHLLKESQRAEGNEGTPDESLVWN